MTAILAAQAGRSVTDHAVILDGDEDELRIRAIRGGLSSVTTTCGRLAAARGRVFNPESLAACKTCAARIG